jgi:Xaa-Pro aminopeptidase
LLIVKDEVEIALLRHSQRIIDEVSFPQYFESARVGALDADVQAELIYAMLAAGADTAMTYQSFRSDTYGSGTWSLPIQHRRIQKGDIILTEPVPFVSRYNTEKMLTFAVGKDVPESQRRGAEIVHECLLLALDEMKPGRPLRPIFDKCEQHLQKKGYAGSTVLIGHWIGMANHEGPRFTPEGMEDIILEPGMVMAWHPNLVVPGEVRTCSSATPLITESGVENMCKLPAEPMYYL